MEPVEPDYANWSAKKLVKRVAELEKRLREKNIRYPPHCLPFPGVLFSNLISVKSYNTPTLLPTTTPTELLGKPKQPPRSFDPSKYDTRPIALKFAYLGSGYSGFEHHVGNFTPLPTIEEELWKALVKCRLIFPRSLNGDAFGGENGLDLWSERGRNALDEMPIGEVPVDWEGVGYSKCGRTDRGVSAFGQVVGLRVRSARPMKRQAEEAAEEGADDMATDDIGKEAQAAIPLALEGTGQEQMKQGALHSSEDELPAKDELPYIQLLNKVLPPTIRALAWCPNTPSNFDARFSCKERQYRYFFTSPAFLPLPGASGTPGRTAEGYLDIDAMRQAASYLVGTHDFRNFCKVDPTKQTTTFTRRITIASVDAVSSADSPRFVVHPAFRRCSQEPVTELFAFKVQGSAFLWHQVRCMVGVLFLVGQGLEAPTIVRELLNVEKNPRKPTYEMACDKPLVLWDCMFSTSLEKGKFGKDDKPMGYIDRGTGEDELSWIYAGDDVVGPSGKWGRSGIMENLWRGWRKAKMDEVLAGQLMDLVAHHGSSLESPVLEGGPQKGGSGRRKSQNKSIRMFEGDDSAPSHGQYVPVMQKELMDTVDVINARYVARKGLRNDASPKDHVIA